MDNKLTIYEEFVMDNKLTIEYEYGAYTWTVSTFRLLARDVPAFLTIQMAQAVNAA